MSSPKHILITGGAGFLGSHLCERLLKDGHQVIALDNFYTGKLTKVDKLLNNPNFRILEHDVMDPLNIQIDEIYHLACPASPPQYQKDPVNTIKTNVLGSLNMLELARSRKAKILFASTSEVYGDPLVHPQPEDYNGNVNIRGPRACYDEGKRLAETLFYEYSRQYGVAVRVVRIFNTYGPGMNSDDGRVVTNFIDQALKGAPITIYGDGTQTRSFCYVDDLIEGMILMMNAHGHTIGPVNLGNPQEFTISELAKLVLEITGSDSKLEYVPLPKDDPCKRRPDITLAKQLLGWEPKIKVKEGLRKAIDFYNKQQGQS